jgi:lipopolysaccharide transport system permease protein
MILQILNPVTAFRASSEAVRFILKHSRLIFEMSRGDLTGRYRGQFFGSVWVIVHPLAFTLLYLFLFGVVFLQRIGGTHELPLDYTAYMLSGLIPWLAFQTSMTTAVGSIINNSALVKQFIFPIEILPIRDVVSSLVTWIVGIVSTLIYILISQQVVMTTWIMLPILFIMQFLAMVGVAFMLSTVAVFFRDVKEIVQLFTLIAMFILPIVFLPGWVPDVFRPLLWVNPFTYMIYAYQDVIYFGRFEHPFAWFIFSGWTLLVFGGGYRLFQRTKPVFGSLL